VDQFDDGRAAFWIVSGADDAEWLVEGDVVVDGLAAGEGPAVNFDAVAGGVDLGAELEDNRAVDADAVFADHALRRAARGHAGVGQNFVKPLLHVG
jgi:hypothetical protein